MSAPFIVVEFDDDSTYRLDPEWEGPFVDVVGHDSERYPEAGERVRWLTEKYYAHQAWPSKLDGLLHQDDRRGDDVYDDHAYYLEPWSSWPPEGRGWGDGFIQPPPTKAQVAEAVMYQALRPMLLQQALQQSGSPAVVMTPEALMASLDSDDPPDDVERS